MLKRSRVIALTVALVALRPAPARAADGPDSTTYVRASVAVWTLGAAGSLITGVVNGLNLARERPSRGFRLAGMAFGAATFLAAAMLLTSDIAKADAIILSGAGAALGGLSLGLGLCGGPLKSPERLAVVPVVGIGVAGRTFGGLGVRLAGF